MQVARDGVEVARRQQHDIVIIDTAGRLGVDAEMMKQASDIRKATDPDEVLFVIDAMIGQDAVNTAKAFQDGVDFTGVVLSKLDGDARGGAALSVASVTGRPIIFASTGEGLDDLEAFHPDRMASRILDLGDILTLIEQAQQAFDEEEAMKMAEKLATETFTLEDFLEQMQQLKKMGSMKKMLGMLPGMGPDEAAARGLRRARDRPHRGDHPLDDAGGAPQPQGAQRLAAPAHRARLRHDGDRRQRSSSTASSRPRR